jgi:hypothetical protein
MAALKRRPKRLPKPGYRIGFTCGFVSRFGFTLSLGLTLNKTDCSNSYSYSLLLALCAHKTERASAKRSQNRTCVCFALTKPNVRLRRSHRQSTLRAGAKTGRDATAMRPIPIAPVEFVNRYNVVLATKAKLYAALTKPIAQLR